MRAWLLALRMDSPGPYLHLYSLTMAKGDSARSFVALIPLPASFSLSEMSFQERVHLTQIILLLHWQLPLEAKVYTTSVVSFIASSSGSKHNYDTSSTTKTFVLLFSIYLVFLPYTYIQTHQSVNFGMYEHSNFPL